MEMVYHPNLGAYWGRLDGPPNPNLSPNPRARAPIHFESRHYNKWTLDMATEETLGLSPPMWSTTTGEMGGKGARPLGKSLFDARFHDNAMGRARGGYSLLRDARGVGATAGELRAAENMDSNYFALDMADETSAASVSAEKNKFGDNTQFSTYDDNSLALSQMSQLQRRQLDKDGDGILEADELAAHGFSTKGAPAQDGLGQVQERKRQEIEKQRAKEAGMASLQERLMAKAPKPPPKPIKKPGPSLGAPQKVVR